MADFDRAFKLLLEKEGGFVDHPEDPGGTTKYGVSLAWLKNIPEGDLTNDGVINYLDVQALTIPIVKSLFQRYFWDKGRMGEINSQVVADKLFGLSVLFGLPRAARFLQVTINLLHNKHKLVVDGWIGDKTLREVNSYRYPGAILGGLKGEAYVRVRVGNPTFRAGWYDRIMNA